MTAAALLQPDEDEDEPRAPPPRELALRPAWTRQRLHGRLTPRQRDVIDLTTAGHSHREVAARLGISRHTVLRHMDAILRVIPAPDDADTRAHITRKNRIITWALWERVGHPDTEER